MKLRIQRLAAVTAVLVASLSVPSFADSERMELHCESGSLAGHTIERSNGSSWWDRSDGTVYTTRYLRVTSEGEIVHEQSYGRKAAEADTCTAEHFGSTWYVEVVAAGAPG